MCAEVKLSSVFRTDELRDLIERQEPSEQEHHDLFTIRRDLEMTADEVVQEHNDRMNDTDAAVIATWLHNLGRVHRITQYELPSDYENIFAQAGLRRRRDRRLPGPIDGIPARLVEDMRDCFDEGLAKFSLSRNATTKVSLGPIPHFYTLFAYLPARLDLMSWIGRCLMESVDAFLPEISEQLGTGYAIGRFVTNVVRGGLVVLPDGNALLTTEIIGKMELGHLVCVRQGNRLRPLDDKETARCREILRAAERMLVLLSFDVASRTAIKVCEEYAIPGFHREQRPLLDRIQIGRAVREILGEHFFDLPFDRAPPHCLKNWSEDYILKPDDVMDVDDPYL